MAEAFGIAGSAFGTVSLGLQLFKEISQYLDDIDGREEDLKQARNFATNIQISINALDVAISNAPNDDPTTKNAIDSCKVSCVSAVNNFNAARAKELCAKLKYPFKKHNIEKLEENLSRANSALQTILQVFQLNTGHAMTSAINSMHQALTDVNVISDKNKTALDEMHKTSQVHGDRLSTVQQDVRELLILTRDSEDSKLLLRTIAQQVSDLTSHTSVAANLLQNPAADTFIPSIQTTSYQGGGSMAFDALCSCKTQRIRHSQRHWGPLLLKAEVRSRDHHAPECPMSKLPASTRRTKRVLSLLIPTSQRLWGRTSRVSLSFTTGVGILGIGQTVAWIATVDERLSPVFRLVDTVACYDSLPRKDMHFLLASCFRRLIWCYANSHASVTDVNEDGDTILGWTLLKYLVAGEYNADNIAELFQMLTIIAEPTSCTRKITAIPLPVLIAASGWFSACTRPDQVATTILSKCSEPVGHHHTWDIAWRRDEYRVGAGYILFQAFPQVAENLEFGPLTQAVLKQDRNAVQQLLERCPSYINETNYCGQSPVHLAIETQNIAIISVVLHYADAKALRARDNRGIYPIDYVARGTRKHIKEPQEDCEECKVLEMLLRLNTALFPTSLRAILRPWYNSHSCIHGRKIIIKGLAERREGLKELSYRRLSPAEREGLEVHQTRILDQNAARVQHQLEAQGCPVPTYLSVYEEDIGSSYDHESIYSLISDGEVAEYAHQLGFYYSDNEFADFICSLAFRMSRDTKHRSWTNHGFSSSYLCWMLDHGMSVSSKLPAGKLPSREIEVTAAHYFMASLGLSTPNEQQLALDCPLSLAAVEIVFSETIVDRCRCWCSPGGCTPLVKLLEGLYWWRLSFKSEQHLSRATEGLIKGLFSEHRGKISDCQWIYTAIIRYYTFVELGLRHVCCSIVEEASGPLPEEELQEIEQEDLSLLGLFRSLLTEFEDGRRHDMSLEEFFEWVHMNWAPRMQEIREELASQRLTDEQLRDAESIGVVWEAYGPPPMEKKPDLRGLGEGDLWDAMDQLDQIATDPERPMKESLQTYT
ncbi:hypothetical protein FOXG_12109 [Fusarium oxysporum f. sp. lycopersici 4287]|uniref:Fungal N-terminal domain-containing protein n=1 Tax=Fusarium oxysporum f. sp. lycopersici (strain 4287 / CBS 123668 / FGSC 9935 / NRRL 34936) TaxID=426428 RepID=A0A0J9VPE4_FUSO4|nr:hypothetical protein FOXG_12109 [Fusarium oxysporum f. sp. lycopersici 4287]KNB12525.1 hypothetical protein FOXG_12109 [Fusarium oxysporum f. sp. lycopersici 4287]